eukprot:1241738-Amphidinium_carterae.1
MFAPLSAASTQIVNHQHCISLQPSSLGIVLTHSPGNMASRIKTSLKRPCVQFERLSCLS